jgi:hypothetical protein
MAQAAVVTAVALVALAMAMAGTAAEGMGGAGEVTPTLVIVANVTMVTTGMVVRARTKAKVSCRSMVRTSLAADSNTTTVGRTSTVKAVEVVVVDLCWTRKSASA